MDGRSWQAVVTTPVESVTSFIGCAFTLVAGGCWCDAVQSAITGRWLCCTELPACPLLIAGCAFMGCRDQEAGLGVVGRLLYVVFVLPPQSCVP